MFSFFGYKYYVSLCCIVKDETPYLVEWIDYHAKIGVEHFYIYDNESIIPVSETIKEYIDSGIATVIKFPGRSQQMAAYQHCLNNYRKKSRWIGFIDMDEFIVPKSSNGDLKVFLKDYENFGGLGINWLIFGSNGHITKPKNSQLQSFIYRSKNSMEVNNHIKSIVQTRYVFSKGINPHQFSYKKNRFCVNENFERIDGPFSKNSTNKIQINHYHCRSLEEYKEKILRGRADDADIERSIEEFHNHNNGTNEVKDTTILEILNKKILQS